MNNMMSSDCKQEEINGFFEYNFGYLHIELSESYEAKNTSVKKNSSMHLQALFHMMRL